MTTEFLNKVYDLLISIGGADDSNNLRESFIYNHKDSKHICKEWRFAGKLGFGGKYLSETNTVNCYPEDETPERLEIIKSLNVELKKLSS